MINHETFFVTLQFYFFMTFLLEFPPKSTLKMWYFKNIESTVGNQDVRKDSHTHFQTRKLRASGRLSHLPTVENLRKSSLAHICMARNTFFYPLSYFFSSSFFITNACLPSSSSRATMSFYFSVRQVPRSAPRKKKKKKNLAWLRAKIPFKKEKKKKNFLHKQTAQKKTERYIGEPHHV